jgi:hypothetical protein
MKKIIMTLSLLGSFKSLEAVTEKEFTKCGNKWFYKLSEKASELSSTQSLLSFKLGNFVYSADMMHMISFIGGNLLNCHYCIVSKKFKNINQNSCFFQNLSN